jgi:hypothetical protein
MAPGCVNILMHHGSAFSNEGVLTYEGGEVSLFQNIEKQAMSYFNVVQLAASLGFKDGDNLFYAILGRTLDEAGIDHLKDDTSISEMLKFANQTNFLEVYSQHNEHSGSGYPTAGYCIQQDSVAKVNLQLYSHGVNLYVFKLIKFYSHRILADRLQGETF